MDYKKLGEIQEKFEEALKNNSVKEAKKFLKAGANPNGLFPISPYDKRVNDYLATLPSTSKTGDWWTCDRISPLILACAKGNLEMVKLLVNHAANLNYTATYDVDIAQSGSENIVSYDSFSPLHIASAKGHLEIVKFLLDKGAKIDKEDELGHTSLYKSVEYKKYSVAKFLLENRADSNLIKSGYTHLGLACYNNDLRMVKLLVSKGANINLGDIKEKDNKSPLKIAMDKGYKEIADFLIANGSKKT